MISASSALRAVLLKFNSSLSSALPEYTGYCPQYRYRMGDTYGSQTHKLLLDPTVNRSEKLVLSDRTVDDYQVQWRHSDHRTFRAVDDYQVQWRHSDHHTFRTVDDYQVFRPPQRDIDIVEGRFMSGDPIYQHPTIPGYEGFIPRINAKFGQRYSVQATEALSEFENEQMKAREALNLLHRQGALQDGRYCPRDIEDRQLTENQFRLPLTEVRPELAGVLRNLPVTEPAITPPSHSTSPYFMKSTDPEKYLISGGPSKLSQEFVGILIALAKLKWLPLRLSYSILISPLNGVPRSNLVEAGWVEPQRKSGQVQMRDRGLVRVKSNQFGTGSGQLAGSGRVGRLVNKLGTGSGQLAGSGRVGRLVSKLGTGSGQLAGSGRVGRLVNKLGTGSGQLAASVRVDRLVNKLGTGSGKLDGSGRVDRLVNKLRTGSGQLAGSGRVDRLVNKLRTGSGQLAGSGRVDRLVNKLGTGSGQLAGSGRVDRLVNKLGTGSGQLDGSGRVDRLVNKLGTGSGQLDGSGRVDRLVNKLGTGSGQLAESGRVDRLVNKLGTGSGQLDGSGRVDRLVNKLGTGSGQLAASGRVDRLVSKLGTGSGQLAPSSMCCECFSGHVPFGYSKYGSGNVQMTNSALCDFTSNYRRRQSTEWAPVNVTRFDPPLALQPTVIYHKHVGLVPNYLGHVPGEMFRFGKTYGNDTRDAKRWLRGDYTM
uniref:Ciliary microtubule inner protein 2A-C-like domain-containing protein n=1 Tax=Timema genevievae TaxID=629358 RepID=A0A7R9PKC3_TIMGE|nr:unnamed protein product [Timema genevievae]